VGGGSGRGQRPGPPPPPCWVWAGKAASRRGRALCLGGESGPVSSGLGHVGYVVRFLCACRRLGPDQALRQAVTGRSGGRYTPCPGISSEGCVRGLAPGAARLAELTGACGASE